MTPAFQHYLVKLKDIVTGGRLFVGAARFLMSAIVLVGMSNIISCGNVKASLGW